MNGAAAVLLPLLLLCGRAEFTAARTLNAPQDGGVLSVDGTDSLIATVTGNLTDVKGSADSHHCD